MISAATVPSSASCRLTRNFAGNVEDQLAIRELIDTYGDAVTRRDVDLWAGCWAANGRWKPGNEVFVGRDSIVEHWTYLMQSGHGEKGSNTRLYLSQPGAIVLSGSEGRGWTYTTELLVDDQNMTFHMNGLYSDLFIREDGRWVYLERVYRKLHIDRPY
jgi:SnoaL-like domain